MLNLTWVMATMISQSPTLLLKNWLGIKQKIWSFFIDVHTITGFPDIWSINCSRTDPATHQLKSFFSFYLRGCFLCLWNNSNSKSNSGFFRCNYSMNVRIVSRLSPTELFLGFLGLVTTVHSIQSCSLDETHKTNNSAKLQVTKEYRYRLISCHENKPLSYLQKNGCLAFKKWRF